MAVVSTNIQHTRYDPALPATTEVFAECIHRIKVPGVSRRAGGWWQCLTAWPKATLHSVAVSLHSEKFIFPYAFR